MLPARFTIAIDGPSGSGKSTAAKNLARELGVLYLDTGAMYRAMGYAALQRGLVPGEAAQIEKMLPDIQLTVHYVDGHQQTHINGEDVTTCLRTPEVSKAASDISALPAVRTYLVAYQRQLAKTQSFVMDGRDIGTYVLPDASYKFFLISDPKERARRRLGDLREAGNDTVTYEDVLADLAYRDQQDSSRAMGPTRQADDAVLIDNTFMTSDQVLARMLAIVREEQTP